MHGLNWIPIDGWFGTAQSLQEVIDMTEMVRTSVSVEGLGNTFRLGIDKGQNPQFSLHDDEEDEENSYLLEIVNGVGVINISGTMTNNDSWINRYFGVISYQEIRRAITDAANDPEVESILMNFHSGGGPVSGVFELSEFMKNVGTFLKPIESIANGLMGSAAYLLGVTADKVHATKMSTVGSIGVISIHKEFTKMFKEQGIQVNIVRTGKYKALVNPFEKLSDLARSEMQDYSDKLYGKFISHVALQRNVGLEEVDQNMAQGREFLGEDAFRVGLVDNLTSIDTLVIELSEQNEAASRRNASSALGNPEIGDDDMKKKQVKLSSDNIAKLAAGIPLKDLNLEDGIDVPDGSELSAEDKETLALEAQKEIDDKAAADLKASQAEDGDNPEDPGTLLSHLKSESRDMKLEIRTLTKEVSTLTTANTKLETDCEAANTVIDPLETIVRASMDRLAINLGNIGADYSNLSGLALSKAYTELNAKFEKRYPVGGQASLDVKDETPSGVSDATTTARNEAAAV